MNFSKRLDIINIKVQHNKNYNFQKELKELKFEILKKDPNNKKALILLGKIYCLTEQNNLAIKTFNEVNEIEPNQTAFLWLYKSYSKTGNFIEAQNNIEKYKKIVSQRENNTFNSELIDSLLSTINTDLQTFSFIENKSVFMYQKITNTVLQEKYEELVERYNNKEFKKCIGIAESLQIIADNNKLAVEFNTIYFLMKRIYELSIKDINIACLYNYIENQNYYAILYLLNESCKNFNANFDNMIKMIKCLVKHGYEKEVQNVLDRQICFSKDKQLLKKLKSYFKDYKEYYSIDEEKIEMCEKTKIQAGQLIKKGFVEEAYYLYSYAYYLSNHSIFIYYMAKCLNLLGYQHFAYEEFQNYCKQGIIKKDKAKYQLFMITGDKKYLDNENNQKKHYRDDFDFVKYEAQKSLKFTLDDFKK